jgi:4-hydroxybenzoyl-CoA reductase subunit alpha
MPPITSEVVDSYEPSGPWGVKEVGEGATNPTLGMFSNAIFDAMGVRVNSLPLSYEKVWRALKEKREREEIAKRDKGAKREDAEPAVAEPVYANPS